jgi:hypothetical protein
MNAKNEKLMYGRSVPTAHGEGSHGGSGGAATAAGDTLAHIEMLQRLERLHDEDWDDPLLHLAEEDLIACGIGRRRAEVTTSAVMELTTTQYVLPHLYLFALVDRVHDVLHVSSGAPPSDVASNIAARTMDMVQRCRDVLTDVEANLLTFKNLPDVFDALNLSGVLCPTGKEVDYLNSLHSE